MSFATRHNKVNVFDISTEGFVYYGLGDLYDEKDPEKVKCQKDRREPPYPGHAVFIHSAAHDPGHRRKDSWRRKIDDCKHERRQDGDDVQSLVPDGFAA